MPTIKVAQDDLVLVIPQDANDDSTGVRVFVGDRPVGFLQELLIRVGVTQPAEIQAQWVTLEPLHRWSDVNTPARILAAQSLMAPWLAEHPVAARKGPTLWERLDDDP